MTAMPDDIVSLPSEPVFQPYKTDYAARTVRVEAYITWVMNAERANSDVYVPPTFNEKNLFKYAWK